MKLPIILPPNEVEDDKVQLLCSRDSNRVKLDSKEENALPNTGSPMKAEKRHPAICFCFHMEAPSIPKKVLKVQRRQIKMQAFASLVSVHSLSLYQSTLLCSALTDNSCMRKTV